MSWKDKLTRLDPRERRLLTVFFGILSVLVLIFVPLLTKRAVIVRASENELLRKAIDGLTDSQQSLLKIDAQRQAIIARYGRAAPALGALLDNQARQNGLEIPESQDRPVVPHGKRFDERSTRIQLRKVGLASLARFMESVERAQYPVVFSRLDIRKRLSESDSYDVELVASAYDRKEPAKNDGSSRAAASTTATGSAAGSKGEGKLP
jgi:general secretion pathway protein M